MSILEGSRSLSKDGCPRYEGLESSLGLSIKFKKKMGVGNMRDDIEQAASRRILPLQWSRPAGSHYNRKTVEKHRVLGES